MTPDEAVRRVKCALAEMGYGDAEVTWAGKDSYGGHPLLYVPLEIPNAVLWQACRMAYSVRPCWSCWLPNSGSDDRAQDCARGNCTAGPDEPRTPPRELLVAR